MTFENKTFNLTHNLILPVVDGKIFNELTDTHNTTFKYYLCGVTSKQFNLNDETRDKN